MAKRSAQDAAKAPKSVGVFLRISGLNTGARERRQVGLSHDLRQGIMLMLALIVMTCIEASATCRKVADLQGNSTLAARGRSWDEAGDSNATDDWWRTLCMPDSRLVRLDVQAVGISIKWRESASAIHIDTR